MDGRREFGLDDHWAAEADAAAAGAGAGSDGAGPLEVFDSLLLLAETYPDPATYLRTWDRLRADEEAHADVADDTLAREEAEEDRVVIGTIHAAKGREYHSVVIPDYDCDVSRWSAAEIEEERRVVYVGVTRARDSALFTVDTSTGFVHPFLRELVEAPDPGEHESSAPGSAEEARELRERIAARLAEIEALFRAGARGGGSGGGERRAGRRGRRPLVQLGEEGGVAAQFVSHRPVVGLEAAAPHLGLDRLEHTGAEAHAPQPVDHEDRAQHSCVKAPQPDLVESLQLGLYEG